MSNVCCNNFLYFRALFFSLSGLLECVLTLFSDQSDSPEGEVTVTIHHSFCDKAVTSAILEHRLPG